MLILNYVMLTDTTCSMESQNVTGEVQLGSTFLLLLRRLEKKACLENTFYLKTRYIFVINWSICFRLLITVLDILILLLKSKHVSKKIFSIISNSISLCREEQFIPLIRELFISIEYLPSSFSADIISHFSDYIVQYSNRIALLKKSLLKSKCDFKVIFIFRKKRKRSMRQRLI